MKPEELYREIYLSTFDNLKSILAVRDKATPSTESIDLKSDGESGPSRLFKFIPGVPNMEAPSTESVDLGSEPEPSSTISHHTTVDPRSGDYRSIQRRIVEALRWADVHDRLKWSTVILGDAMPSNWFNINKSSNDRWGRILNTLAAVSSTLTTMVMQEVVVQLGKDAPVALFAGSNDHAFLSWFNGRLDSQTIIGQHGGLRSVSWIAGRIAQLWYRRTDVHPAEKYWFTQLIEAQQLNPRLEWPAVGSSAVAEIEVDIAWDRDPNSSEPLLISPLDRIIETVIPGLQFVTNLRRLCTKCNKLVEQVGGKTHLKARSTSSQVLDTLHSLEVARSDCGMLII
jgi:phage FluMu protein Com